MIYPNGQRKKREGSLYNAKGNRPWSERKKKGGGRESAPMDARREGASPKRGGEGGEDSLFLYALVKTKEK